MEKNYIDISFEKAKTLLDSDSRCLMLDVREESEYFVSHADGAVCFPVDEIEENSAKEMISSKETPVIVYCKTGTRAVLAAEKLCALGYQNVYNLGSLVGWPYGMGFGAY
ncbi:MAG: rhodanese-like domain-containing protein [Acutalibacteraceae bacterium]